MTESNGLATTLILVSLGRSDDARTVAQLFGLPDPTTQLSATRPSTAPATQRVSIEQDAEIRRFIEKLKAEL